MGSAGLLQSFLAAVQASLSVLLVMCYGGLAAHLEIINRSHLTPISKLCVRIFLPALLITKVGSQLDAEHAYRYMIILIWAIVCHVVSFLVGIMGHRCFGMPDWTAPSILISNTTSYPLLLITALEDTGILNSIIVEDESAKEAIERAKSYFLIFSTVSNLVTFAVGPRLIDTENAPEDEEEDDDKAGGDHADGANHDGAPTPDVEANEHSRLLDHCRRPLMHPVRCSSFLLAQAREGAKHEDKPDRRRPWFVPRKRWHRFGPKAKWWLLFVLDFFNAPLLGAFIGAVIGLVPALHRAFFTNSEEGGIFTAWITSSLKSTGELFVSLPVVVAGITLFCSTKEAKDAHENPIKNIPWGTVSYILFVRFLAWPVVSLTTIYLLCMRTSLLGSDPILWFCLAIMPCGPSAMKLLTMVQVAEGSKDSEEHISRLLTISYLISPLLSLTVAGSLMVSQAAIKR